MAARVSKHWSYNPTLDIKEFNQKEVNDKNLVNMMLVLTQKDITSSFIMNTFGSFNSKCLAHHYDTFDVPPGAFTFVNDKGKLVSNTNKFTTTFGIWIFNIFLIQGFQYSFLFNGYINEEINKKKFGKIHTKIINALIEDKITVESYKNFIIYCDFIMPWETFLAPSQSEKLLACSKEINKLKKKLLEENKEAIEKGDAAVAEAIEKKLIAFALEYLKDDPALDGYLSGAGGTLENNFKNMYVMKGAIRNPDPNAEQEFNISKSSFVDGISADEYSLLANSLAGGPYSRSKKTEIGGYWEKLVGVALNAIKIDGPGTDCGTDKYLDVLLTPDNASMYMYNYIIKNDGTLEELTTDNIEKYYNKKVKMRSILFCKSKSGVCHHCAGNFFYRRGSDRIGLACASIPTRLKLQSMKSFHNSTVSTVEIDPMKAFNVK